MIDPKELRIGNLLEWGIKAVKVKSIHTKSNISDVDGHLYVEINNKLDHYAVSLNQVSAIPLTDEWLVKFGFQLFPWGWVSGIAEDSRRSLRITVQHNFEREGQSPLKIQYVHQLQNLYFALTGEELTIKQD